MVPQLQATEAIGLSISLLALGCLIPLIWRSRQLAAWLGLLSSSVGIFLLALAGVVYGSASWGDSLSLPGNLAVSRVIEALGVLTAVAGLVALAFIADGARRRRLMDQALIDIDLGVAMSGKSLSALLDSTADALIVAHGLEDGSMPLAIEFVRVSEHAHGSILCELRGATSLQDVAPLSLRECVLGAVREACSTGAPARFSSDTGGDDSRFEVWAFASGSTALIRVSDVTARHQLEEELRSFAYTDMLTGLANRRKFEAYARRLERVKEPSPNIALAYLDLNGFKEVNDAHGHKRGDAVLVEFAERLVGVVGSTFRGEAGMPLAARIGGDEFVVVLVDIDASVVEAFATHLYDVLSAPYGPAGHAVHCPASIGVVSVAGPLESIDVLLQHADAAMYSAKFSTGKSLVVRLDSGSDGDDLRRRRKSDWHLDSGPESVRRA
ncbi:MAG: GGDEF domain-containing protein [Phycisphaerales bacterium]|jgi:diguanylate cyclase (GGDEF)-like protein